MEKNKCYKCDIPMNGDFEPLWKCFECKNLFCSNDIWSGRINKTMSEDDEVRNVCDSCVKEFDYVSLDDYYNLNKKIKTAV